MGIAMPSPTPKRAIMEIRTLAENGRPIR